MLNMPQINHIRDLSKCGYRISDIHKETGILDLLYRKESLIRKKLVPLAKECQS